MQLTSFVPVTESYVWSDRPRNTMKVKRRFIENEDDSRLVLDGATQVSLTDCAIHPHCGTCTDLIDASIASSTRTFLTSMANIAAIESFLAMAHHI